MKLLIVAAGLLASVGATYSTYEPTCTKDKCYVKGPKTTPGEHPGPKMISVCESVPHIGPNPHVAVPTSEEENDAAFHECGYSLIGLTDDGPSQEGTFYDVNTGQTVYIDHPKQSFQFTKWKHGQPNDYGHNGQDVVKFTSHGKWEDVNEWYEYKVCCAYDNKRCVEETGVCFAQGPKQKCEDGSPPGSNYRPACKQMFGDDWQVAVPQSEDENDEAYKACGDWSFIGILDLKWDAQDVWFNLNDFSAVSDGPDCVENTYCNWLHGQPNGWNQHAAMFYDGAWADIEKWKKLPICCEYRPDGSEAPSAAPTPDPVSAAPTPADLCRDGITNNFENVCCAAECGLCGGCDCAHFGDPHGKGGPDFCCPGRIFENAIECVLSSDVGCILDDYVPFEPIGCH